MRQRFRAIVTVAAALALCVPLTVMPSSAVAHVDNPTLTALHAFVGDTLWGLDTAEGTLLGVDPDSQTAMASTTKIMTLHLAIIALQNNIVGLNDQVTVSAVAAGIGGSTMQDINGVNLEPGEVVSLELLIRGMMYPSGNDAAWAIAEHVAQGYFGPAADSDEFVTMMNQRAAALGLVDTQFANPNGFDDPNHYTTARELAELWDVAADDDYFLEVTGFQGMWSGVSQGPNGPKTYQWTWGFGYPGWEGAKGGGTPNCNGPNNGCMIMSARRLGRQAVVSFMQGQPWTEEPGLFDFAFGTIFHPDPHGVGAAWGQAVAQDVDCLPGGRTVSSVVSDGARLVVWNADVDNSAISELGSGLIPGSDKNPPLNGTAVARLGSGDVIAAFQKGQVAELSRWEIAQNGTPLLLSEGFHSGPTDEVLLQPVYSDMFLTVSRHPDGSLFLKSWRLEPDGGLKHLRNYNDDSREYEDIAVSGPQATDVFNGHRAITTARDGNDHLVHQVWAVDPQNGEISELGELDENLERNALSIAPVAVDPVFDGELFPPTYYATGGQLPNGQATVRYYRIAGSGNPVHEGTSLTSWAIAETRVAPLGQSGVFGALRRNGIVTLAVWEARRQPNNDIVPDLISEHEAPEASSLELCRLGTTHSEGDYVTGTTDAGGQLRLRAYRSGDRPY